MTEVTPLYYTRTEIESYLPSGWRLGDDEGDWDAEQALWRARVLDGVDFEWPLEVAAADAAKRGRMEALREAMDRIHRVRLGDHTRGLGLGVRHVRKEDR